MKLWKLQFSVASLFVLTTLTAITVVMVQNWPHPPTKLELVDTFNQHMDDQQYREAMVVAEEANRLYPDDEILGCMRWKAEFAIRITSAEELVATEFNNDEGFVRPFVCLSPDYDFEEPPHPENIDWAEYANKYQTMVDPPAE